KCLHEGPHARRSPSRFLDRESCCSTNRESALEPDIPSSESTCARTRPGKSRRRYAQAIHPDPHVGLARIWRTSLAFSATALIVVDETGERGNAISFRTR